MKKFLTIICAIFSLAASSQIKPDTSKKVNVLPLPLIFRSPETWWAAGLSGSISFKSTYKHDSLTRTSNVQLLGMFTERQQNIQAVDATIYLPKNNYVFLFQSSHSYFPDKYWGLGPNTSNDFESYRFEQYYFTAHLKKKIAKNTFVGILNEFQYLFNMKYVENGNFDKTIIFGKDGYVISGLGGSFGYDTRNSGFWPTKGVFLQTLITYFNKNFGAKYNDLKTIIDLRYFKKIFRNHIIATQFYSYSNSGDAPYRELAMLGGSGNLRGFYQGRYRDNSMITAIAEYRMPVYNRFAVCFFGGVGNVYDELNELPDITRNLKYAYGGGLRFAVLKHERLNLRLDYGYYDKINKGVYFTIGECF